MHLQLLDELKGVEMELRRIVEVIEPPDYGLQWYGERALRFAQPKDVKEVVGRARSPRRQDTETGARGQENDLKVKLLRERAREWFQQWTWHKLTTLSLW